MKTRTRTFTQGLVALLAVVGFASPAAAAPNIDLSQPIKLTYVRAGARGTSYTAQPVASTRVPGIEQYFSYISNGRINFDLDRTFDTNATINETSTTDGGFIGKVAAAIGWQAGPNKVLLITTKNNGLPYAASWAGVVDGATVLGDVTHEVGHTLGLNHATDAVAAYGNNFSVMGGGKRANQKPGTIDAAQLAHLGLLAGWPAKTSGAVDLTAISHPTARSTMRWDYGGRRYWVEYRRDVLQDSDVIDGANEVAGMVVVSVPYPYSTTPYMLPATLIYDFQPSWPFHAATRTGTWYTLPGMKLRLDSLGSTMHVTYQKTA